jgi:histidinol dehydrogenase
MVPILECADTQELAARLAARSSMTNEAVAQKVKEIVADIRTRGDAALFEYTEKFDHVRLSRENVQVTREEIEAAYAAARPEWLEAMREAAARITAFHEKQKQNTWVNFKKGVALGQKITPLRRAGVYVPGGTAAYPS